MSPGWQLTKLWALTHSSSSKRSKERKVCCCVWTLFFFFRYEEKKQLHLRLHQVIFLFRITVVYCITLSPFSILMNSERLKPKMKSHLHVWRFWLPGWKTILLFHAAGAFSTEIGLLLPRRSVQE